MQKIFKTQYEKLLIKYINNSQNNLNNIDRLQLNLMDLKNINQFYRKYVPKDILLIKKFPEKDLKTVLRLECNVDKIKPNTNEFKEIIDSTKKLRKYANISEKAVCSRCSKRSTCKFFEKVPKEGEDSASLLDLHITLQGFYLNSLNISDSENQESHKKQFELDSESHNFPNNKNNKSIKLKTINLKANSALAAAEGQSEKEINEEYVFPNTSENRYTKAYYYIDSDSEKIIERIPAASWKSSSILTQLLKDTLEDLVYENGIVYKTMVNAYIESKEKEKISALIKDENLKESNRRDEIKNDPIVALINKLESCKNRSERKRLLAEFNKTVGFGWGEYRKIPKFQESDFDKNYEDDLNNDNNQNTNNVHGSNGKNNKEIYRKIADESMNKNSNNYNTIVYSEKKINKIYSDTQRVNMIGSKFTQKINVKNQKIKALENQTRLSLMLNDESADRTHVKIPGKDYEKAISYIGEDKGKIENFEKLIDAKKKDYSVDLRNYVKNKHSKTDKLMDQSRKITLLQLEKIDERKMLEKDRINSESAMLDFEMKVGKDNLLENKYPLGNENCNAYEHKRLQHSSEYRDYDYDKNLMVFGDENENKNLSLASSENKSYDLNSIQFRKLKNERQDAEGNITLYKQENQVTKNSIKVNQDKAKIKKVIENKHVYQSMNYYKNNDLEHLAYERDPDVMNALKFSKAIKKDKYYYDRDRQLHSKREVSFKKDPNEN